MNRHSSPPPVQAWILIATALSCASLACSTLTGVRPIEATLDAQPTREIDAPPTLAPATADSATEVVVPEATEAGDATPIPAGEGRACFITGGNGQLHCVDSQGLKAYTSADFALGDDYATHIAPCGSGFAIAYYTDVVRFDGTTFEQVPLELPEDSFGVDSIACDPAGERMAVVASGGFVLLHENGAWLSFDMSDQDRDGDSDFTTVNDVALPDDGTLWVALAGNIARWDGKEWTVFEKGVDWEDDLYFTQLDVAPDGIVIAAFGSGLLSFEGGAPLTLENNEAGGAYGLDVSADRILVGHGFGAYLLDRSGQIVEAHPVDEQPELPFAASIYSVAIDGSNRLWLGTTYNLLVIDADGTYHSFRMDNTDLTDSAIDSLAVQGTPPLPPLVEHALGSLAGVLSRSGEPLADVEVSACTIDFSTEAACDGDPNRITTRTDAKGAFVLSDVPRGRYVLYATVAEAEWLPLADADGFYLSSILVDGEPVDFGEIGVYE